MKKTILFCLLLTLVSLLPAQYNLDNLAVTEGSSSEIKAFTFKNLRLYPIRANEVFEEAHSGIGNYIPLKTALKEGKIKILEKGTANSDNLDRNTRQPNRNTTLNVPDYNEYVEEQAPVQTIDVSPLLEPQEENEPQIEVLQQISNLDINQVQQQIGGSATVNTLYLENVSEDTLYLMAGEVVKGGKQDRVLAQDMVIPPNSGEIDLSVFCVEKGRWTYKDQPSAGFDGYFNVSSTNVRKAVQLKADQTKVWEEVDKTTKANAVESETSAYTQLEQDGEFLGEVQSYVEYFQNLFSEEEKVIGVVAVTSDKVMVCDMFATHDLFANAFPNLLHSYATEAISHGEEVHIGAGEVEEYLYQILAEEESQEETISENGNLFKHKGKKLHITKY